MQLYLIRIKNLFLSTPYGTPKTTPHHVLWKTSKFLLAINCNFCLKLYSINVRCFQLKRFNSYCRMLWKVFRPQAYTADDHLNLRTVHQMELRTLQKMGFHLQVVNLATWHKLTEEEQISFLEDKITMALQSS